MPESVPLIPAFGSMQDGTNDEISSIAGSQFDILGNKFNEEKGFKINTFPLKNIIITSEGKDINTTFHIDAINNDTDREIPQSGHADNSFDFNDDIEFADDISTLPPSMQISLKGIRSCFNQLNNVLVDISDTTKGLFKSVGFENERLEIDFRKIEKDRSSLVNERQFKSFTAKSDFISQVAATIKL